MKKYTLGVFVNRDDAERFINYIQSALSISSEDISYVYKSSKDTLEKVEIEDVRKDPDNILSGARKGAGAGAVVGALAGIAATVGFIASIGSLFIAGPIIAILGIAGAAAGAVGGAAVGGFVGGLIKLGVEEKRAKEYEKRIIAGNIFVAIRTEFTKEIELAMRNYGASNISTFEV